MPSCRPRRSSQKHRRKCFRLLPQSWNRYTGALIKAVQTVRLDDNPMGLLSCQCYVLASRIKTGSVLTYFCLSAAEACTCVAIMDVHNVPSKFATIYSSASFCGCNAEKVIDLHMCTETMCCIARWYTLSIKSLGPLMLTCQDVNTFATES